MARKSSSQKGASMVEFALVLPLLLLILFGIIEFGVMIYDKSVITNASREGARRAIVYRADPNNNFQYSPLNVGQVTAEVNNYLQGRLISLQGPAAATVSVAWPTSPTGDPLVEVQVTYVYNFFILPNITALPFIGGALGGPVTLTAVARMRMEG